ncbi:MAG: filamentous hemagglutinin N-terminal domain-containing protein [Myxococcota bacterium]
MSRARASRPPASAPVAVLAATLALPIAAPAQVVLDGSLGPAGEIAPVGDTYAIDASRGTLVGGGSATNLFYGFSRFDVAAGRTALFEPGSGFTTSVDNVIARIRSEQPSRIDGAIRSSWEGASLWLINPRGVLFSPTATVDLDGELHVTTADHLVYPNGARFDVAADAPLLLAFPPAAYGFDAGNAGAIEVEGSLVARSDAAPDPGWRGSISVVGSSLRMSMAQPAEISASLGASVPSATGTIQLVAVGDAAAEVPVGVHAFSPADAGVGDTGSIQIGAGTTLNNIGAVAPLRGRIVVRGGRLTVDPICTTAGCAPSTPAYAGGGDGSQLDANGRALPALDVETSGTIRLGAGIHWEARTGSLGLPAGAGDVRLAAERLILQGLATPSRIPDVFAYSDGADRGGDLLVEARAAELHGHARLETDAYASGDAGDLILRVDETIALDGDAFLGSIAQRGASGDAGRVDVDATRLALSERALVQSLSLATSTGGSRGIEVRADAIEIVDQAQLSTTTDGSGRAGDVWLHGFETLTIDGSASAGSPRRPGVFARSGLDARTTSATGDAGDVRIEGGTLVVRDGGQVSSAAFNPNAAAAAGSIDLVLAERVSIDGGSNVSSESVSQGDAGSLRIAAPDVALTNGSRVAASTLNTGVAGRIEIDAARIRVAGRGPTGESARIRSTTGSPVGGGDAGTIRLQATESIEVADGGQISAGTEGDGSTGDVLLSSADSITIRSGGRIEATGLRRSGTIGPAGDVVIEAGGDLVVRHGRISTVAARPESGNIRLVGGRLVSVTRFGIVETDVDATGGQGGDVSITAPFVVLERASVTANADQAFADAGNITLRASEAYLGLGQTTVLARASQGISGQISVEAPETDYLGELAVLRGDLLTVSDEVSQSCMQQGGRVGSLQVEGDAFARGAPDRLPPAPPKPIEANPNGDALD